MGLSAATLERLVSGADPEEFAAFVADLWAARGFETRRSHDGIYVSARGQDDETLYRVAAGTDPAVAPDADVVVTAGDLPADAVPAGARVVDAADLYRLLRYAVEPAVADRLLSDHFDYEPTPAADRPTDDAATEPDATDPADDDRAVSTPAASPAVDSTAPTPQAPPWLDSPADAPSGDGAAGGDGGAVGSGGAEDDGATGPTAGPSRRALLAAAAGGVLVGVGVDRGIRYVTSGDSPAGGASAEGGSPEPTETGTPAERPVYAPGVSAAGVDDAEALAAAHARGLVDTSYELAATRTVHGADRQLRSSLSVRVQLAADRTYLVSVATSGPEAPVLLGEPPASAAYWSDGDVYLRRFSPGDGNATYNSFEPPDGFTASWRYWVTTVPFGGQDGTPEQYFGTVFDAIPTTLVGRATVGGDHVYRLANAGRTPRRSKARLDGVLDVQNARNVDLTASIDERGIVRSFDVTFDGDVENGPVAVQRSVEYTAVGETSVDRPSWYDRAIEN